MTHLLKYISIYVITGNCEWLCYYFSAMCKLCCVLWLILNEDLDPVGVVVMKEGVCFPGEQPNHKLGIFI